MTRSPGPDAAMDYPRSAPPVRVPPRSALIPMPRGAFTAIGVAGLAAAVFVPLDRPGVGWLLAALASGGAVYAVDRAARRRGEVDEGDESAGGEGSALSSGLGVPSTARSTDSAVLERVSTFVARYSRLWWAGLALALIAVGTFRAASWLFVLCLAGAATAGSLAIVGRRSAYGLFFDVFSVPFGAVTSLPWLYRWAGHAESSRGRAERRVGWSVAATVGLLLVFVPLLAGADAVFARLVQDVLPSLRGPDLFRWGFVFAMAGLGVAGALYVLAGPPPPAAGTDSVVVGLLDQVIAGSESTGAQGVRRLSRAEWGLPMGALTVLFAIFLGTQLAVLFGGDGYVQRTADLTYAEYARSGFWQLSMVSMLALVVIAVVQRWAAQREARDRLWLRVAVAAVSVLTLVIVASALQRMWTYQQAYGFTVMRVLVEVFELWIALVYLLVLASLVRLHREWVPRAAIGAAAVTLLVLAVVNPEALVADRNIDRWQSGKSLDHDYLSGLSTDILPALDRLPELERERIRTSLEPSTRNDSWQGWNLSRARAR
ncbi:DUF4153 domain-containing protein [Nocardia acidivorans]|uniref:DUF4153 domain-containing protein n=1 Tax=Nocardia acidivorans TaxID=404580 RepID=UPI001FE0E3D9|nr:DUF4173 domain-containing protein [Nocardia acidivorans]